MKYHQRYFFCNTTAGHLLANLYIVIQIRYHRNVLENRDMIFSSYRLPLISFYSRVTGQFTKLVFLYLLTSFFLWTQ